LHHQANVAFVVVTGREHTLVVHLVDDRENPSAVRAACTATPAATTYANTRYADLMEPSCR